MVSVRGMKLSNFPELVKELDFDIHKELDTSLIPAGSNKKLSWICNICKTSYERCPNQRTRSNSACPNNQCMLKKRSDTNAKKFGWQVHYDKPKEDVVENRTNSIPEPSIQDEEVWKDLPTDMKLSKYQVSSLGRLKNKSKDYIFNPNPGKDGYIGSTFVTNDNSKQRYLFHVLLAKTFIENPENKPTVNHINTNKSDNRVINLEWATHSEQNKAINNLPYKSRGKSINQYDLNNNFIKKWDKAIDAETELKINRKNILKVLKGERKQSVGFIWKYCEIEEVLDGEVWRQIPLGEDFIDVFASTLGRIKINDIISYGTLRKSGYFQTKIKNKVKNKSKSFQVHRLICMTFLDNPENKPFVNHKDLNRSNNRLENLEWITHKDNVNHQLDLNNRQKSNVRSKRVLQIDSIGNVIAEFDSVSQAAKKTKLNNSGINWCCSGFRNTKTCGGFTWKYKSD